MGRKRIHPEANLSGAEKQKRYRASQKAKLQALETAAALSAPDIAVIREHARIEVICSAADYFVGKDKTDIARALLSHFMIDRKKAAAVLVADKRTKSMALASLDKSGAWGKSPKNKK